MSKEDYIRLAHVSGRSPDVSDPPPVIARAIGAAEIHRPTSSTWRCSVEAVLQRSTRPAEEGLTTEQSSSAKSWALGSTSSGCKQF